MTFPRIKRERFDGPDSVQGLEQKRPLLSFRSLHRSGPLPIRRQHQKKPADHQADKPEDHERHDRAEEKHHRKEEDQRRGIQDGAEHLPDQEGADLEDFPHVARDQADLGALEKVHRKVQHLLEHVGGQFDVEPRGEKVHHGLAHIVEQRLECREHQHREADHRKSIERLVIDHLVRQQPPEHDGGKRQETQQDGADENIARRPSLTKQQRRDQADAERLGLVRDIIVALDQDDFAGPRLRKPGLVEIEQRVVAGVGVLQNHPQIVLVAAQLEQHHAQPALEPDDGRERLLQFLQRGPVQLHGPCDQFRFGGTTNQIRARDRVPIEDVVVNELRDGQVDAVLAGHNHERSQTRSLGPV